jgi:hypothetical protein
LKKRRATAGTGSRSRREASFEAGPAACLHRQSSDSGPHGANRPRGHDAGSGAPCKRASARLRIEQMPLGAPRATCRRTSRASRPRPRWTCCASCRASRSSRRRNAGAGPARLDVISSSKFDIRQRLRPSLTLNEAPTQRQLRGLGTAPRGVFVPSLNPCGRPCFPARTVA